jgi:hypothetical protein
MLFMEVNGVQTKKHGKKLCVTNSHSWSLWNNFYEQASRLFTKIIIPLKSTIEFTSNFK